MFSMHIPTQPLPGWRSQDEGSREFGFDKENCGNNDLIVNSNNLMLDKNDDAVIYNSYTSYFISLT